MALANPVVRHPRASAEFGTVQKLVPDREEVRRRRTDLTLSIAHNLEAVEAEWRVFEQTADCTVFQCYDWLSTWQRHIGRHVGATPAIVLGRDVSGELVLILPLGVSGSRFVRQLGFLGRELGDYNAPLLARGFAAMCPPDAFAELWAKVQAMLQADPRTRHHLVLLDKMPEHVGTQPNPLMQLPVSRNPSGAYLTALSAPDWETFYAAKRSPSTRRRDRTKRKRLAEHGEIRMVTPVAPVEIAATLSTLIEQKRRALARMGVPDIFARPDQRAFYLDLATNARGPAHVSRLEVGSALAAANLGLEFRGVYYHVLASYDDGPLSRFGPGAAHLHELIRRALERGCGFFDFTIGDEPYKRDWCETELALFDHVKAASPRGRIVAQVLGILRTGKRAIKQSPVLWPTVQRLRAALASLGGARSRPDVAAPSQDET